MATYAGSTDVQAQNIRLTTASDTDVTLTYEVRASISVPHIVVEQPIWAVSPFGTDCGRVQAGADLRTTDLSGLDLHGCTIPRVTLDPTKLTNTNMRGADLSRATILPGALHGTDLAFAQLGDSTLPGVDFSGASQMHDVVLAKANLDHASLRGLELQGSDFTDTNLATTDLAGVATGGVLGTPTLPTGWHLIGGYFVHRTANLHDFALPSPGGTVDFAGFDLRGVNLERADLLGADLHGADLTGANLTGATLGSANLAGTKLAGATLTGAYTGDVVGVPASLPTGWVLRGGNLMGPGVDLYSKSLAGLDLHGLDLHGAQLRFADLTGTNLAGTNLSGTDLRETTLAGTVLTGANLAGADLSYATGTPVYAGVDFATTTCPDLTLGSAHGNTCQGHPWP